MVGSRTRLPVNSPVIVILGPSAVGKTALAMDLAKEFSGEIVSADSRYFYRGMNIGTAKPSAEEMQEIPHHLIDIADPDETISLPQFQAAVYAKIDDILGRNKVPFLVGGTGQYVWGVVEGWLPPRLSPDARLRAVLEDMATHTGAGRIYEMVVLLDPEAARLIDPKNLRRSIRALEVIFSTGELFSKQKLKDSPPYQFKIIGLQRPRAELYGRVDARIDQMISGGLIEETKKLMEAEYDPSLPSMSAIGYKEIYQYLQHAITLEEAIQSTKRRTRVFIRHQANWFKKDDPRIHWFDMHPGVEKEIATYIRKEGCV